MSTVPHTLEPVRFSGGVGRRARHHVPPFRDCAEVLARFPAGRGDIDNFSSAFRRDERRVGFFIGWEFSSWAKGALTEIERLARADEPQVIIPVPLQPLIAETFDTELLALMGR